jgi:hypothetical protein
MLMPTFNELLAAVDPQWIEEMLARGRASGYLTSPGAPADHPALEEPPQPGRKLRSRPRSDKRRNGVLVDQRWMHRKAKRDKEAPVEEAREIPPRPMPITWEWLATVEPRLHDVEQEAIELHRRGRQHPQAWKKTLKPKLRKLVGWFAKCPEVGDEACYCAACRLLEDIWVTGIPGDIATLVRYGLAGRPT